MKKLKNEYRLKLSFITKPNDGNYEAMVVIKNNDIKNPQFFSQANFIERTNQYGNQPKCLIDAPKDANIKTDLRQFCFCKSK